MSYLAPRRRSRHAFTLIELIVTIVVLGILAGLAVPALSAVVDRSRDETTAQSWAAVIREAQALAAFEDRPVSAQDIADALGDLAAATITEAAGAPYRYDDGDGIVGSGEWIVDNAIVPTALVAADGDLAARQRVVVANIPVPGTNPTVEVRDADADIDADNDADDTAAHLGAPPAAATGSGTGGSGGSGGSGAQAVAAPSNVTAVASGGDVTVAWDAVSGADYYQVSRDGTPITTVGASPYVDAGLTDGTYSYTVSAWVADPADNSAESSAAEVTVTGAWEASTAFQQAVLDASPVAYYSLEPGDVASGTAPDRTGNGHHLALTAAASETSADAFPTGVGTAVDGGVAQGVVGASDVFAGTTQQQMTYLFWMQARTNRNYNLAVGDASGWGAFVYHQSSTGDIYTGSQVGDRLASVPCGVTNGSVAMMAITVSTDGSGPGAADLEVYRNAGAPCATKAIGAASNVFSGLEVEGIDGYIADVAVFDRQLSQAEIQAIYDARNG